MDYLYYIGILYNLHTISIAMFVILFIIGSTIFVMTLAVYFADMELNLEHRQPILKTFICFCIPLLLNIVVFSMTLDYKQYNHAILKYIFEQENQNTEFLINLKNSTLENLKQAETNK